VHLIAANGRQSKTLLILRKVFHDVEDMTAGLPDFSWSKHTKTGKI
jgi:hypothetical protein